MPAPCQKLGTDERLRRDSSIIQDHGFVALVLALALIYVGAFLYFVQATIIREPVLDMLAYIDDYLTFRRDGDLWAYLWSNHNEHRLVWTRLVIAADIELFNGITYPCVVFATACLVAVALLMQREAAKVMILPGAKVVGGSLAAMLVLTAANAVDCSLPYGNVYPHTVVFAVLSLVLFNSGATDARRSIAKWGAALLAAIGAAFGTAVGLALWPILVWIGWRRQLSWRCLLATAGVGAVFIALYVHGLAIPKVAAEADGGAGEFYAPSHLYRIGLYLLTYMGLPWTRSAALIPAGRAIGAILLMVSVFVVVQRGIVRPPASRLERLSIGLIMFSLATAALAALGRVDQDPAVQVPVRYSVFLAPLHIGLLFLVLPWLNRWWSDAGYRRTCKAVVLLLCAVLLVQQIQSGRAAIRTTDGIRASVEKFLAGEQQPKEMSRFFTGTLENAQRIENLMRENKIYIVRH